MEYLAVAAGAVIVIVVVYDIFQTLLDPTDQGRLTTAVCVAVWKVSRLSPHVILPYSGPIAYVGVLLFWSWLLIIGWALIYWPFLPGDFSFDSGISAENQQGYLTAFYLSMVTLGTLGFGDITPTNDLLRLLVPIEAFIGFFLLSAAITWILAIYQDIEKRRVLAHETTLLRQSLDARGIHLDEIKAASIERMVETLTTRMVTVSGSLEQFPITYYFRISGDEQSLAIMSLFLLDFSETLKRESLPIEVRLHATMLEQSIDHFASLLAARFVNVDEGASTRDVLLAYAKDHKRNAAEAMLNPQ